MFDSIVKDVNEKYDLGDKAGALVSAIFDLMTDKENGGFAGFINRFRENGLGSLADSWVRSGANTPISYEQTESAFGEETLRGLSEKSGIDYETTVNATAYAVPHMVDELTPNGEIPREDDLLSRVGGVGTSSGVAGEPFDRIDPAAELTEKTEGVPGIFSDKSETEENPLLAWLLPLLILVLLVIVGYMFCGGKSEPVAVPETNVNANVSANKQ